MMILHELLDFFFALESSSWEFLLELRVNDGDAIAGDGNEIWQKKNKNRDLLFEFNSY